MLKKNQVDDLIKKEFSSLEFDSNKSAVIDPIKTINKINIPEHVMLCFFNEVVKNIGTIVWIR